MTNFTLIASYILDVIELDAPHGEMAQVIQINRHRQQNLAKKALALDHLGSKKAKQRLMRYLNDEWNMDKSPATSAYLRKVNSDLSRAEKMVQSALGKFESEHPAFEVYVYGLVY